MGQERHSRKRPCRICGKWFVPHPRLGDRQKSCGAPACRRQWHTKKCAEWNRKNRAVFQESYLNRKLESLRAGIAEPPRAPPPAPPSPPASPPDYPKRVFQEVIGGQQLIIIEYLLRLLKRDVQEVIRSQVSDLQRKLLLLPPAAISRGDSQRGP